MIPSGNVQNSEQALDEKQNLPVLDRRVVDARHSVRDPATKSTSQGRGGQIHADATTPFLRTSVGLSAQTEKTYRSGIENRVGRQDSLTSLSHTALFVARLCLCHSLSPEGDKERMPNILACLACLHQSRQGT